MKKKFMQWLGAAMVGVTALSACGSSEDVSETEGSQAPVAEEQEMLTVGATQIVEHPSLDAAFEGFKSALADNGYVEGENISFDLQSAQGDINNTNTIANNFVADQVDLIFANSTPSAQGALNATDEIPILFTSVTDAVGAGLVEAMDQPGENITGVLDLHPEAIDKTVNFIDTYFEGARVGLLYNSGEQNSRSQIEAVEEAVVGTSLETVARSVSTSAEVQQAAESLIGSVDVFYIVTDNTVVSSLESVIGVANDFDIPLIVGEPDSLARGGFATFGIDFFSIGYRTGEMAAAVLSGEQTPADIPVEYPADMQLFINKEAYEAQGIEWHSDWDEIAEF